MLEFHRISFPDLNYCSKLDDGTIEALAYASGVNTKCATCSNGKNHYIYGERMNFCPKCGRVLE